jgi:RNA-directed DNA polymerase
MKRIGYIYEKIIDIKNIEYAIVKACEHKKKKGYIVKLLNNKTIYAEHIQNLLISGKFKPTIVAHKQVKDTAKQRDVAIPKFYPDQIIHWAVCLQLNKVFMKGMYQFNCGSVPGRGVMYAKNYIERAYRNLDNKKSYTAQLDIKKYFSNISHEKLEELLAKRIKDKKVLDLIHTILHCGEKGLPIGFYTSQWFANFYFMEVDHFIKEKLRMKYYVRYADDMIMVDINKKKIHKAIRTLPAYLEENKYLVKIKDNWQIWKTFTRPLNFLGYKFYKGYTILRLCILKKLKRQLRRIKKDGTLRIIRATRISSYIGWLKHTDNSKSFYLKYIKPVCSKKWISRIISHDSKRRNQNDSKKWHKSKNRSIEEQTWVEWRCIPI